MRMVIREGKIVIRDKLCVYLYVQYMIHIPTQTHVGFHAFINTYKLFFSWGPKMSSLIIFVGTFGLMDQRKQI